MDKCHDELKRRFHKNRRVLTGIRTGLFDVISKAERPISAKEIWKAMPEPRPDLATVYRSLTAMNELGIIRRVVHGSNVFLYELAEGEGHAHHVVCYRCGVKTDLPCQVLRDFEDGIRSSSGFSVDHQSFEIIGCCPKCHRDEG